MDQDAVLMAIGSLTKAVEGQGREIGQLRDIIEKREEKRDSCCRECRTEIDNSLEAQALRITEIDGPKGRLTIVEKRHESEENVKSFLSTTFGQIATGLGILSASAALVAVYVWPVLAPLLWRTI